MTRRAIPVIGAAIVAVLSSGLTTVYLHARYPDLVAVRGPITVEPDRAHLAALLVDPGPPFTPVSGGTQVTAADAGASRQGLLSLGFSRGWTQAWTATGARLDAYVFEFLNEAGAAGYASGIGRVSTLLIEPHAFVVTGVPGASGLADTVRDRDGRYAQLVVFNRGVIAVLYVLSSDSAAPVLGELARKQYAALAP